MTSLLHFGVRLAEHPRIISDLPTINTRQINSNNGAVHSSIYRFEDDVTNALRCPGCLIMKMTN